jgi:hypothetical protein
MIVGKDQIRISGSTLRIARVDAELYKYVDDPEPVLQALRNCGERIDLFTFIQTVEETAPKYKYPMEWENLAVVPITTFDNWWMKQINCKVRNQARLVDKKGIVLREVPFSDELVRGICGVYNETPVRQGRPFSHYGKSFEEVYREEATYLDSATFIGAFDGDELIGFIKMVEDDQHIQAGLMNILSKIAHRDKSPTNALMAYAVRLCAERGIRNLVYSHFAFGNRDRDNLTFFKEKNGFKRVDLPRYYVPLTAWGAVAYKLGLHRRLVDRLPEQWGERMREWRSRWYSRRGTAARASS